MYLKVGTRINRGEIDGHAGGQPRSKAEEVLPGGVCPLRLRPSPKAEVQEHG